MKRLAKSYSEQRLCFLKLTVLTFAWLAASGSQLDLFQALAWSGMFVRHTQSLPIQVALEETFDPEKPCSLCLAVQAARSNGEEEEPPTDAKFGRKIILWVHIDPLYLFSVSNHERVLSSFEGSISQGRLRPPGPPPRLA